MHFVVVGDGQQNLQVLRTVVGLIVVSVMNDLPLFE